MPTISRISSLRRPENGTTAAQASGGTGAPLDVVIYEDDHLTRALLREWLSGVGYRVRAGAPRDAQQIEPAHLVVVGVYMPKSAGRRCVCDIRAMHPDTPMIAISGQFRPGLCTAGPTAQTLGVQWVIAKPVMRDELLDAVCAMIGKPA
jgi:CheY-like chemotaxis protein